MPLDMRTAILTGVLLSLALAVLLSAVRARSPAEQAPALRVWVNAVFLLTFCWLLLALRGRIQDLFSVVAANTGLVLALSELGRALGLFQGRSLAPWLRLLPILVMAGVCTWYLYIEPDYPMRVLLGSAATVLALLLASHPTWPAFRRGGGLGERVCALVFAVGIALLLLRIAGQASGLQPARSLFEGPPVHALVYLYLAVAPVFASFGLLLMSADRSRVALQHLATIDSLTGALARHALIAHAGRVFAESRRHGRQLSLLLIDVDHFKRVNDTYGHDAGDRVLRSLTDKVAQMLRTEDAVGRLGGEEFVVVLPNTDEAAAAAVAERIRVLLAGEHAVHEGMEIPITVSIGVAGIAAGDDQVDSVIKRADLAMYAAKHAGRNRVMRAAGAGHRPP